MRFLADKWTSPRTLQFSCENIAIVDVAPMRAYTGGGREVAENTIIARLLRNRRVRRVLCAALLAIANCGVLSAGDYATEMVEATFKFYDPDSTATCFFVRRESPDKALYLVTAAHVLERTKGKTAIVVLRERLADGSYERRDCTIAIRSDGKPLWVRHAKEDAAVLRLSQPFPVPAAALSITDLVDENRLTTSGLHICSRLFVLTYPQRFEGNDAGFAVARQGIVASHPMQPVERYRTFLASFTTFAGDSGGPVFVAGSDGHPLVIGIVLAQIRYDERVTAEYEERTTHHPFGLGKVLHAQFIRETVEQAAKRDVAAAK
jgi:hypothetical protein